MVSSDRTTSGGAGRTDRELFNATRPFAHEIRARSWRYFISTYVILIGALWIAIAAPWWPLNLAGSILSGLVLVRVFILYHDFMHGAILSGSPLAKTVFYFYGCAVLTPPSSWGETHNYHHANVTKIEGPSIGSFPILTVEEWRKASLMQRFRYRISRHPLTIFFAYITVFLISICLAQFVHEPRKHWDSLVALAVHFSIGGLLWLTLGPAAFVFGFLIPIWVASMLGAYLFYAQHNFPAMKLHTGDEWNYFSAALESSSYLKLGPVLNWFTGNIGYHHVHHVNSRIPFYRLREAMEAVPELQNPGVTTLKPRDIVACLRLDLWDEERGRMISFEEVRSDAPPEPAPGF